MGRRNGKTKVRAMSAEAVAAREHDQRRAAIAAIGQDVGIPAAQLDPARVEIVAAEVGRWTDGSARTVRKVSKAEMLARSGAIDPHHLAAINLYVEAAEIAYDTCVKIASYGEGGGSSPTGAASAAHGRLLDRADVAHRYQRGRASLPQASVAAFERIVLDNHAIGSVGQDMYPALSAGQISHNMRELVRTCADCLYREYRSLLPDVEGPAAVRQALLGSMIRLDAQVRAERAAGKGMRISDQISAAVLEAVDAEVLFVSPAVRDAIARENGLGDVEAFGGLPVCVVEHWSWGWIIEAGNSPASSRGRR